MAIAFGYTVATNTMVITGGTSGTPATFNDVVLADRAGTGTFLKTASAPSKTYTLTYPVRPVEFRAVVVKFVIAAKTAEADYLFITGTDAWDAAQTESIDVSAGNGTYTSTKRWRTISNISCSDAADGTGTLWADGTLAVTQDIWGVIWDYTNYLILDAIFYIGDGSTSTFFADKNKVIDMGSRIASILYPIVVQANGNARFGTLINEGLKSTKDTCIFRWLNPSGLGQYFLVGGSAQSIYLYSTHFVGPGVYNNRTVVGGKITRAWNCSFTNEVALDPVGTDGDFYNIDSFNCNIAYSNLGGTMDSLRARNPLYYYFSFGQAPRTVSNVVCAGTGFSFCRLISLTSGDITFINPISDTFVHTWQGTCTRSSYLKFLCDINVCDKAGNALEDVVVDCEDQYGTPVWAAGTVLTNASGNIAQQTISYQRHYATGTTDTTQTYSPHKFTFSKAGYEIRVIPNITVSGAIGSPTVPWEIQLKRKAYLNAGGLIG